MPTQQRGAVLIVSLLILLIITLTSVNMVQQNRLQFLMAANSQMGVTTLSNAEDILLDAERYIASQRYLSIDQLKLVDSPLCKKETNDKFYQLALQDITEGLNLSSDNDFTPEVKIIETSCLTIDKTEMVCFSGDNTGKCSTSNPESYACCSRNTENCTTELYTIEVKILDESLTERTTLSKYSIKCGQADIDLFPKDFLDTLNTADIQILNKTFPNKFP